MVDVIWRGDDAAPTDSKRGSVTNLVSGASTVSLLDSTNSSTPTHVDDAPDLPPRRKSGGWSLGFKTLGGGRGLGFSSKPGSPTSAAQELVSPGRAREEAGVVEIEATDSATEIVQLAAPDTEAETKIEEVNGKGQIEAGDEHREQDGTPVQEVDSTQAAANIEAEVQPVSSGASETSENPNGFSTPQTSSAPLSPEQDFTQPAENDGSAKGDEEGDSQPPIDASDAIESQPPIDADNSIDLSSPRASLSQDQAASETVLPPTPTRPARRAVPVPPAGAPAIPERSRARPASLTLSPRPDPAATAETMPVTPDPSTALPIVTPMPVRPPTLPARTEKRISIVHEKEDGEEVDSWESKTWKEVVRLKEEMWKARVGVTEEST
jgi:hypothetical protein